MASLRAEIIMNHHQQHHHHHQNHITYQNQSHISELGDGELQSTSFMADTVVTSS